MIQNGEKWYYLAVKQLPCSLRRKTSMSKMSSFRSIESKYNVYRGTDYMKRFCESSREHTMNKINFKKKKMKLLT